MRGRIRQRIGALGIGLALGLSSIAIPVAAQDPEPEFAVRVNNQPTRPDQTGVELMQREGSWIKRHDDRVEFELRMKTPVPGTYKYPEWAPPERQASPEVFSVWVTGFNHPENCVSAPESPMCGPDDFTDAAQAGVYNLAGHIPSVDHEGGAFILNRGTDGDIVVRGTITVGQTPRSDLPKDPDASRFAFDNPAGAEFHVAIAPHGQLQPEALPNELYEPDGSPSCGCWWVATFVAG